MYEVFDLQYASPATISRCGMVYVDPKNLGYRPYYVRWVKLRCQPQSKNAEAGFLMDLFDKYVSRCVEYVLEGDVGVEEPELRLADGDLRLARLCVALGGRFEHRHGVAALHDVAHRIDDVAVRCPECGERLAVPPLERHLVGLPGLLDRLGVGGEISAA